MVVQMVHSMVVQMAVQRVDCLAAQRVGLMAEKSAEWLVDPMVANLAATKAAYSVDQWAVMKAVWMVGYLVDRLV
jgi:hypothetical protein